MSFLNTIFKRKFIERAYRFLVEEHHDLSVAIDGDEYAVENISTSGICLRSEELSEKFRILNETIISLRVNGRIFSVSADVARRNKDFIAFAVSRDFPEFKKEVRTYFNNEMKSINVVRRDVAELKYEGPGEIYWYYGDRYHELYFIINQGHLVAFWVNCRNLIFEFNAEEKLKTFLFSSQDLDINEEFSGESQFKNDPFLYSEMNPFVVKFLNGINNIDEKIKSEILKTIESGRDS
jgi:hypothetical protein